MKREEERCMKDRGMSEGLEGERQREAERGTKRERHGAMDIQTKKCAVQMGEWGE